MMSALQVTVWKIKPELRVKHLTKRLLVNEKCIQSDDGELRKCSLDECILER